MGWEILLDNYKIKIFDSLQLIHQSDKSLATPKGITSKACPHCHTSSFSSPPHPIIIIISIIIHSTFKLLFIDFSIMQSYYYFYYFFEFFYS